MNSARATLVLLLIFAGFCAAEEETTDQKEAKEAAAEDDAEKLLPEDQQFAKTFAGKLNVTAIEWKSASLVVGTLVVENGPTYQLKIGSAVLLKQLTAYDNKKCMLLGKLRNKGKYLIVSTVIEAGAKPVERRKRGGM
jgi:hypothetical protein